MHLTTSFFSARTVVAGVAVAALVAIVAAADTQDGCRMECYPNTKMINGKGGIGKNENCRWILRTDGKAARLCDHIKCRKVCPNNQAASSAAANADQQQEAAASDNLRIEQQTESDSPAAPEAAGAAMGIMRHMHGNKMAKAPVPGVAGGRLASAAAGGSSGQSAGAPSGGRRMAPTMPPAVQYDENDTPPPISRFLDISPEE